MVQAGSLNGVHCLSRPRTCGDGPRGQIRTDLCRSWPCVREDGLWWTHQGVRTLVSAPRPREWSSVVAMRLDDVTVGAGTCGNRPLRFDQYLARWLSAPHPRGWSKPLDTPLSSLLSVSRVALIVLILQNATQIPDALAVLLRFWLPVIADRSY